ncbi:ABC-2 type transport system permease protein [Planomicrobium stackebrandtii]|uniref:ABC-2 type transport system permease protein n=1 Tax=Planomicrobium stackebrandtii TaxID=253160 RepID=A0ABU0GZD2_9BACL|nr:ABC transporter permease [Planomicrobium stackebrandtii]MDQ0430707.1 ABC-2 type transport system permease protein [Planomicrobium stackebrandtii]
MARHLFDGTGTLMRFVLRRDRLRLPIWLLSFAAISAIIALAFVGLYQNAEERQAMAETMRNPAMTAMVGPGYGLDNYTVGAMTAHEMLLMTAVVVGLMSILLVTRHTRTDEEDGRIEMIRSLPVGRLSNLLSILLVLIGANIVLALLTAFSLTVLGIESMDFEGSLVYGSALGASGMIFAGVAAVCAQLSPNSRNTLGLSIAVLLFAYMIRAIGDVTNEALSWISPLNWILRSEAYVNNYWWPILMTVAGALLLMVLALYLNSIRDLGSGFLPSRPGKGKASKSLLSPFGLALRLQRTGLIAWGAGILLIGASYGSVLGDLESFFEDIDLMQQMIAQSAGFSLTEQFIPVLMAVMAILGTIPVLMAILKLKTEEKNGRLEHILSRAVSRNRLMGSYLAMAIVTGFIMLSLAALGLGLVGNAMMEEQLPLGMFYSAGLAYLPAMLAMIGVAMLLIGWAPNAASTVWLYLAFSFFVIYLGGLFQFPEWVAKLTPYGYVSEIPIEEMDFLNAGILIVVAAVLMMIGVIGFNRRDIGR